MIAPAPARKMFLLVNETAARKCWPGGNPIATVLGKGFRTSAQNAALANGYLGHFEDYDDTHNGSGIHPASPIVPAALAIGEQTHASGRDILAAYAIGAEVACRAGAANR